jgi:hypothetical protein
MPLADTSQSGSEELAFLVKQAMAEMMKSK